MVSISKLLWIKDQLTCEVGPIVWFILKLLPMCQLLAAMLNRAYDKPTAKLNGLALLPKPARFVTRRAIFSVKTSCRSSRASAGLGHLSSRWVVNSETNTQKTSRKHFWKKKAQSRCHPMFVSRSVETQADHPKSGVMTWGMAEKMLHYVRLCPWDVQKYQWMWQECITFGDSWSLIFESRSAQLIAAFDPRPRAMAWGATEPHGWIHTEVRFGKDWGKNTVKQFQIFSGYCRQYQGLTFFMPKLLKTETRLHFPRLIWRL